MTFKKKLQKLRDGNGTIPQIQLQVGNHCSTFPVPKLWTVTDARGNILYTPGMKLKKLGGIVISITTKPTVLYRDAEQLAQLMENLHTKEMLISPVGWAHPGQFRQQLDLTMLAEFSHVFGTMSSTASNDLALLALARGLGLEGVPGAVKASNWEGQKNIVAYIPNSALDEDVMDEMCISAIDTVQNVNIGRLWTMVRDPANSDQTIFITEAK